jgi:hypothetical protein
MNKNSEINTKEIDKFLEKWYETKKTIILLENKCENYKKLISQKMKIQNINSIQSSNFILNKRTTTRESISKKYVPDNIWKQYCNKSTFDTFSLKKSNIIYQSGNK